MACVIVYRQYGAVFRGDAPELSLMCKSLFVKGISARFAWMRSIPKKKAPLKDISLRRKKIRPPGDEKDLTVITLKGVTSSITYRFDGNVNVLVLTI